MYVCVCVCMYVCMCVYVCMFVCMYVCIYACMYVRTYVCVYTTDKWMDGRTIMMKSVLLALSINVLFVTEGVLCSGLAMANVCCLF